LIDKDLFNFIKKEYGLCSSWAIWSEEDAKPKSNVGDLSIFDPHLNKDLYSLLNPNVILVGLNLSKGAIEIPFSIFHSKSTHANDYKIRFALKDSPFWGGYMTDIIKDYDEKMSREVMRYIKENPKIEKENVNLFYKELEDLKTVNPTIIAFGNDVFNILKRNLKDDYRILKVPHYAHFISKEEYREKFQSIYPNDFYHEQDCPFCEIPKKRILEEDELCYVIRDGFPVTDLHTLVIPKRHVETYFDLYQPELNSCNRMIQKFKERIEKEDESVKGFNIGINNGEVAGQTVFHCHIHLIPRREGDVENPRGGVRGVIQNKQKY